MGVARMYYIYCIVSKIEDGRHLCNVKTINLYNFRQVSAFGFQGMADLVVWPESSLTLSPLKPVFMC